MLSSRCIPWSTHSSRLYLTLNYLVGLPVIGEIEAPGFLEGGDFFSAGRDLAMVGIGLRSNFEACRQLMERDLLGTRRLAIVRDEYEQHQVRLTHNRRERCPYA